MGVIYSGICHTQKLVGRIVQNAKKNGEDINFPKGT